MNFDLFGRKRPILLGVDIGATAIKVMEMSVKDGHYRVESYAAEPLPLEAIQEREIKNIDAVGMVLEQAVKQSKTSLKNAAVAIADSAVITKIIQLNAEMNESEMAAQITLEAERYIPHPLQEVNIDFQVIGQSSKMPGWCDVLLAASRTENIDALVEILNIGGLTAKVVDIEAYAIGRAFGFIADQLPTTGKKRTIVVANMGANMMTFSVLHDRTTIYTREQIFGGKQLTQEIQLKEVIVQHISRALQFFYSSTQFVEIDHIVLAGATPCLLGLSQRIEEKLNISTSIANPFVNMSFSHRVSLSALQADAPALMICCGLAMRSFANDH